MTKDRSGCRPSYRYPAVEWLARLLGECVMSALCGAVPCQAVGPPMVMTSSAAAANVATRKRQMHLMKNRYTSPSS